MNPYLTPFSHQSFLKKNVLHVSSVMGNHFAGTRYFLCRLCRPNHILTYDFVSHRRLIQWLLNSIRKSDIFSSNGYTVQKTH